MARPVSSCWRAAPGTSTPPTTEPATSRTCPVADATDEQLRDVERWFTARGTPHLIEGYSAAEDVFTRALPVLTLVLLLAVSGALNADFLWWQNLLAAAACLPLLLGIWESVNLSRCRPPLTPPAPHVPAPTTTLVTSDD